jgi:AraC-like DNA-binding protein
VAIDGDGIRGGDVATLFDARKAPTHERMEFWLNTVCSQILPVQIDPRHDAAPAAAMSCLAIGDMAIRTVVGGDHVYSRSSAELRAGDPDTLQIGLPLGGSSILVQDGREAVLSAGDMVLYDSSRPFTLAMQERFHWQVFLFPKSLLRRPTRELRDITAIRMRGDTGLAGVVQRFLRGVARDGARLEVDPEAIMLGKHAADLAGTLIRSTFGKEWDVRDTDGVLRERVSAFIQIHHSDPRLGPGMIALAHNVSLRRLHAAFEGTERSVMDEVRRARLDAIRSDLCDSRFDHQTIGRIAASHGLPSLASFSRAFRNAYGVTPSEFRATA